MKRLDLVQLTIIIVGIMSAYSVIIAAPQLISLLWVWFTEGDSGGYATLGLIPMIILLGSLTILSIYAIKNSKQLAEKIAAKANLQADINLALNKKELLFALFVGLGIYGLIEDLPVLLKNVFIYIQENSASSRYLMESRSVTKSTLFIEVLTTGLYFILVYYANVFAEFLASKIKNTEPEDEINSRNES